MSSASCFGVMFRPFDHPVTSVLLVVMVGASACAALGARQMLCLIWNHTFMTQFYFWNVLSSSFVETHSIKFVASLIGVVGMAPCAEDALGHVGMAVFLLLVALLSGIVTSSGIFVAYIVTREEYLLDLELHGSFGLLVALSVAAAQPDPAGSFLPGGRAPWFPRRYFPLLLVTVSSLCRAMSLPIVSKDSPFVVVGAYAAWVYLRFFAHTILGRPSGDVNDEFQLVMFFPAFMRRLLKPVCDFTYGVFLLLGLFKGRAAMFPLPVIDDHGGVDPSTVAILPELERKDPIAERRRARAMKLLDEKFAKLNAKPANRWEDDEGWGAGQGGAGVSKPRSATAVGRTTAAGMSLKVALPSSSSSPPPSSSSSLSKAEIISVPRVAADKEEDDWGVSAEENGYRKESDDDDGGGDTAKSIR